MKIMDKPQLGFGLGLRPDHYNSILDENPHVDWLEIITENYLIPGGKPHYYLDKIRALYPIVMHGVSLSIGSSDPLDLEYLNQIKNLAKRIEPQWISDHLCWTGIYGKNTHDLLPLPYTEEVINHIVKRIQQVQDILERQILIENVSSYLTYNTSTLKESIFLKEISERADCLILLDINNIYVSSINHDFDPSDYIADLPAERIYQIHLAGHSKVENYLIDTHDHAVIDPVWNLYANALRHIGPCSTMIERDDDIPPLSTLIIELDHARKIAGNVFSEINP